MFGVAGVFAIISAPYRMKRIEAFFHPFEDTSGKAYQLVQSLITIAGGGFSGVGLGNSQQKLHFLPASHTDFIFAVVAEELGFLGAITLMTLFICLFYQCMKIVRKTTHDTFAYSLSIGLTSLIFIPAFFNFGVVTGMLPTKGLVLPFIGYGGSNIIATFLIVGLLLAIVRGVYKREI
ncbi:MAG: FtsW/RodA/SpoVE family cell cycle protein [Bdellovibrionota bacterium]